MKDKSKIIVATCYRVGTLGLINQSEITNTVKKLVRKKKVKKFILVGDFNLPGVSWSPVTSSTNSIEKAFIDAFADMGLVQCIHMPTHARGNTLDLLLSTSSGTIDNIMIDENSLCKSDHYLIRVKTLSNSNLRLKDSNDIIQIEILRSITDTSSHSYFRSLDIKSLYTSCNMKDAQRIVKSKLQDHPSLLPSNI